MEAHDIDTLSFLIASFKDIVQSFGQNSKSVEFYKRQVDGLLNIGQIRQEDADFIEELVGMENTNAVKWDIATQKIEQFIKAMNATYNYEIILGKVMELENLEKAGQISKIAKLFAYKAWGIDIKDISAIKKKRGIENPGFGSTKSRSINRGIEKDKEQSTGELLKLLIGTSRDSVIKIRNSEAVCSGDPSFFMCNMLNLLDNIVIMRELSKGSEYKIGKEKLSDDICHPTRVIKEDEKLMRIANKIDWKSVYEIASNTDSDERAHIVRRLM